MTAGGRLGALLLCVAAACGGADKKATTTPDKARAGDPQAMNDFADPANRVDPNDANSPSGPPGSRGPGAASPAGGPGASKVPAPGSPPPPQTAGPGPSPGSDPATPMVTMPNYDPEPNQARSQVDQHLRSPALAPELEVRERRDRQVSRTMGAQVFLGDAAEEHADEVRGERLPRARQ